MEREPLAVLPARNAALGIGSLLENARALAVSLLKPAPTARGYFAHGEGRVVLVVPAFLAGDWAMARLRRFLAGLGYRVETAGVLINLGPTPAIVAKLERRLLQLSANGPIAIVGQSLGGVLARDLAARHPERVRRLVTLCSPIRVPITTPLAPAARPLEPFFDSAWLARRARIAEAIGVPVTALYSEEDGVVDWRECLQVEANGCENVKVCGAHATIASSPEALAAIARALSS